MNINKFIAVFLPLMGVSLHAAVQTYLFGATIDNTTLKIVVLGLFILGVLMYIAEYNQVLFVVTTIPMTALGIYLTSPVNVQIEIVEVIKTLLQGVI